MKTDSTLDGAHLAWLDIRQSASTEARAHVAAVVEAESGALAALFYERMLTDADASRFLDHALVHHRLNASMTQWLRHLFVDDRPVAAGIAEQRRTGEVHARIGISMDLISAGARVLKRAICQHLAGRQLSAEVLTGAVQYVYETIDFAVDTMNVAYESNANRIARSDEAYRMLFLGRDMRAERERQRTHLLEWAQQIQMQYYWDVQGGKASSGLSFAESQFGLWLQHKASMLFESAPEIAGIHQSIETIEQELLPQLSRARDSHDEARAVVAAIARHVEAVKALIGSMFDRLVENRDGRDSVTQLLNRRYFPVVAKREIDLANGREGAFALLILEMDHFARLRASADLDTPDLILWQVADTLQENVRAGDFVFRLAEERFAVLLVETDRHHVKEVADGLRRCVAGLTLQGSSKLVTSLTASIGIALFDGHPDYQHLLDRAERALLSAARQGGNQCVMTA